MEPKYSFPKSFRIVLNIFVSIFLVVSNASAAEPDDFLIFHARGQDYEVTNPLIADIKKRWTTEKSKIEQAWINKVNAFRVTVDIGPTTATLGAENTKVTLSDLPALSITQGADNATLDFSSSLTVNWSTRFCAPFGGYFKCDFIDVTPTFTTQIAISGSIKLDQDVEGYFLQITSISGQATGSTLYDLVVNPTINAEVQKQLDKDTNSNGIADLKEPLYLDPYLPDQDILFPVYAHLEAGGAFPFSLSVRDGIPVVSVVFGDAIIGDWLADKIDHPRLLYTAAQRPIIQAKAQANFQGWYDQIKQIADMEPDFPVPDENGIISEADWATKAVPNARMALTAALVYDLEEDRTYLYKTLKVLFRFRSAIREPLFTQQWGQNSLYAAETLTTLSQAYDLLLGRNFPNNISKQEILDNEIGFPTGVPHLYYVQMLARFHMPSALSYLKNIIERRFRHLRDVIHLQTHVWDLAGVPNFSLRNAGALGISAILFNREPDAYENISLATTVIWKRLGVATSRPFDDVANFTKVEEGFGYSEGPHYLLYASELYLPFMWAYQHFTDGEPQLHTFIYNDWATQSELAVPKLLTSDRVRKAHEWSLQLIMPDGARPPFKDTNRCSVFYSGILANQTATPDPMMQRVWAWEFAKNAYPVGFRLVDNFVAFDTTLVGQEVDPEYIYASPTQIMLDAGNAVLRSGWDDKAIYMHLLGDGTWLTDGVVGGMRIPYHQQADNTSFLIYAHGELLALDAGYGSFPLRNYVANADNHNLVLVDGGGPSPVTNAKIEGQLDSFFLDYAEVGSQYQDTDIRRHALFIDNRYFLMADVLQSSQSHRYDWQLHGAGSFSQQGDDLTWTVPSGVRLLVHVTDTQGGIDAIVRDNQSPHFEFPTLSTDDLMFHTSIQAREYGATNLAYLTALVPVKAGEAGPSVSHFTDGQYFTGLIVEFPGRRDILLVKHPEASPDTSYHVSAGQTGVSAINTNADLLLLTVSSIDNRLVGIFARSVSHLDYGAGSYVSAPSEQLLKVIGDMDGDGCVDRADLYIILADIRGPAPHDPTHDLNGDGAVNIADARYLVNLFTNSRGTPCE